MMLTILRTSDGLKLVVDNHDVDVDLHCAGVMLLQRAHVVLLVVVGFSRYMVDNSDLSPLCPC